MRFPLPAIVCDTCARNDDQGEEHGYQNAICKSALLTWTSSPGEAPHARQGKVVTKDLQEASALRERVNLRQWSLSIDGTRRRDCLGRLPTACRCVVTMTMFLVVPDGVRFRVILPILSLPGKTGWMGSLDLGKVFFQQPCAVSASEGALVSETQPWTRACCHLHVKGHGCHKVGGCVGLGYSHA